MMFMRDIVMISEDELRAMKSRPSWTGLVATVELSMRQDRALSQYRFDRGRRNTMRWTRSRRSLRRRCRRSYSSPVVEHPRTVRVLFRSGLTVRDVAELFSDKARAIEALVA
jgi:hypothetical protein